jgi:hypothetical protein
MSIVNKNHSIVLGEKFGVVFAIHNVVDFKFSFKFAMIRLYFYTIRYIIHVLNCD